MRGGQVDAEIKMLNAHELDVEECERRLEMAVSAPETMLGYLCVVDYPICGAFEDPGVILESSG